MNAAEGAGSEAEGSAVEARREAGEEPATPEGDAGPAWGRGVAEGSVAEVLGEVLRCLTDEEWASERLCELGRRKQRVLVAGAATELVALVQAEQVMLAGLSHSESRRVRAMRPLTDAFGLPAGASIDQLAAEVDPESAASLRRVGARIAALFAEISALNEQNARLIRQSLAFVDFSLGVIARAVGETETYARTGRRVRREVVPRALNCEV